MKKALVLAGGGTRGSYQYGAVKALLELEEMDFDIITGTSIGALNGTLLVQRDYQAMADMWHTLSVDKIIKGKLPAEFNLESIINERNLLPHFFKTYIKEKGVDNSPFIELLNKLYNPEKFAASDIDFGCVTVGNMSLNPIYVDKHMMKEHGADWLIATASCFPAFPVHSFSEGEFIDGGYFDNLPIDLALRKGAEELTVIDLSDEPHHSLYVARPHIRYIFPQTPTGSFLDFSPESLRRLETLGYNDTMKSFHVYDGAAYTFRKMDIPSYFDRYYLNCLMTETKIRTAMMLVQKIRSESRIYDRLREQMHLPSLTVEQFCFGIIDDILKILDYDMQPVYDFRTVQKDIVEAFAPAASADYDMMPGLKLKDIKEYVQTLDQKGIVMRVIHQNLFPEDIVFKENMILTVYPFEQALADMVTMMMKNQEE